MLIGIIIIMAGVLLSQIKAYLSPGYFSGSIPQSPVHFFRANTIGSAHYGETHLSIVASTELGSGN